MREIGTSTFAAWQVLESQWVGKEPGFNTFFCKEPPYNLWIGESNGNCCQWLKPLD